jgi:hypothetical protein
VMSSIFFVEVGAEIPCFGWSADRRIDSITWRFVAAATGQSKWLLGYILTSKVWVKRWLRRVPARAHWTSTFEKFHTKSRTARGPGSRGAAVVRAVPAIPDARAATVFGVNAPDITLSSVARPAVFVACLARPRLTVAWFTGTRVALVFSSKNADAAVTATTWALVHVSLWQALVLSFRCCRANKSFAKVLAASLRKCATFLARVVNVRIIIVAFLTTARRVILTVANTLGTVPPCILGVAYWTKAGANAIGRRRAPSVVNIDLAD